MDQEKFRELLPMVCSKETSSDPDGWTAENPLWGHCAVVSLVAQDFFGGKLMRASLEGTPFAKMRSHYWNLLDPKGDDSEACFQDFTMAQFGPNPPVGLEAEERTRAYLLGNKETKQRYKTLMLRLTAEIGSNNVIFRNPLFYDCLFTALDSPCQKRKYGCIILHKGELVAEACNSTIEPLKVLCQPTCIRFNIQSRTESMIGACGHAEEQAMEQVIRKGIPLCQCELYVAGLDTKTAKAFVKSERDFTCIRCATQIWLHGVGAVYVPVSHRWEKMSAEETVRTAKAYALREKTTDGLQV